MIIGEKKAKNVKRVSLFVFGALIGSLAMYFMVFKDKSYFKTPEQTIKDQLKSRAFVLTKHGACRMECRGITEQEIKQLFINGSVNYDKSEVHEKPCKKYALEGKTADGQNVRIICGLCDLETKIITAIDLGLEKDTCACD